MGLRMKYAAVNPNVIILLMVYNIYCFMVGQ
jgi:hypothetical protein